MFSLLGDGDREDLCWPVVVTKKGEVLDSELSAGDSIGGLRDGLGAVSARIQGPDDRFSDTADSTGEVVRAGTFFCSSCFPSA